jgi:hypothetical protein
MTPPSTRTFSSAAQGPAAILAAMSYTRTAGLLAAAASIAVAAGVGYLLHKEAKKRSEARAVVMVLTEATEQLKSGLKTPSQEALERVEGNVRLVQGWSSAELADATEHYLVGVREILRRRAEASRLARKASASRAALSTHMSQAGQRDSSWIRNASELKKKVERDHFDLEVQLGALADLLEDLPEANKRLAPHVQASLLLDDAARRGARAAVLEESKQARAALERARSLPFR